MMQFDASLMSAIPADRQGYLAGEYPQGITTKNGVPCKSRILVAEAATYRAVASTVTGDSGTWLVTGLDAGRRYNVIARDILDEYSDVVAVRVRPTSAAVVSLDGQFGPTEYFDGLDGFMTITSGLPPFSASVVEALPSGLNPVINGRVLRIAGESADFGLWSSLVRVTAGNGVLADVPLEIEIKDLGDPHWDNVVSLLLFGGTSGSQGFADMTGKTWISRNGAHISDEHTIFDKTCAKFPWNAHLWIGPTVDFTFYDGDYTVEGWVLVGAAPGGGSNNDRQIFGSFGYEPDMMFFLHNGNNAPALWDGAIEHLSSISVTSGEWSHFAFSRNAGMLRIFTNGEIGYTGLNNRYFGSIAETFMGSNNGDNRHLNGFMGPFRVTKGVGRYTSPFTPPVRPFPKK